MQQEQKESLIGEILKTLIATFGIPLIEKMLNKHKEESVVSTQGTDPVCKPGQTWSATLKACVDDPA